MSQSPTTTPMPWPKGCPKCASMWSADCKSDHAPDACRMVCPDCGLQGPVAPTYDEAVGAWNEMVGDMRDKGLIGEVAKARIAQRRALKATGEPHDLGSWLEHNFARAKS